ncbi:MAG: LuxR C-terminal-related transcriptional regulator [Roseateles sp.]
MAADFSFKLADPASPEDFAAELSRVCQHAGFEHYLALHFADDQLHTLIHTLHNAPPEARVPLQDARHWSVARMVERLRSSPLPLHYGRHQPHGLELPGYQSGVAALARDQRGGVIIAFGAHAPELDTSRLVHMLGQVCLAAQLSTQGFGIATAETCPFSQQQLACLQLRLQGHSSKQTAQKLGISFRTVEHHLESARRRCGVTTTMAVAYHAVERSWLQLPAAGAQEASG